MNGEPGRDHGTFDLEIRCQRLCGAQSAQGSLVGEYGA
jgi:hypothetical protein